MKKVLLASVAALAFAAVSTTASASVTGTIGGSYANDSSTSPNIDMWNLDGSLTMNQGSWGGEIAGGYHNLSGGGSLDVWNIGGSLFWNWPNVGRLAGTVNYDDFGSGGVKFTSYGAGLDWFVNSNVTVDIKGGGTNIDFGCSGCNTNGGYVGGMLKYYAMGGDLAASGTVDYFSVTGGNETDETLRLEYLHQPWPVSIYAGYQHQDGQLFFGGTSQDVFFVGLKFYFNNTGTLEDRQRNGSLGYISKPTLFWDQY